MDTSGIVFAGFLVFYRSVFWQFEQTGLSDKILHETSESFLNNNVHNAMLSFGDSLHCDVDYNVNEEENAKSAKVLKTAIKRVLAKYVFMRKAYHNNMFIDSGGFQIQMGLINAEAVPLLTDAYCQLMRQIDDPNTYYYIEDVLPSDKIKDLNLALDLTIAGIKKMSQLPEHIRKNIYYIYHFQTPEIFKGWQRVLKEAPPELLGGHRWSVGGIVSKSGAVDSTFVTYMLPIQDIIRREWDYLQSGNTIYLHILGVSAQLDILFFALFEELVNSYGLSIHMTFDSTSAVRSVCRGNIFWYWSEQPTEAFHEINLRPKAANKIVKTLLPNIRITNEEVIYSVIEELRTKYGFAGIDEYYNKETNRLYTDTQYIFMLYQLFMMKKMHEWCRCKSSELIDIFRNSTPHEFIKRTVDIGSRVHSSDRATSVIKSKVNAIYNTLRSFDDIFSGNHKTVDQIVSQTISVLGGVAERGYYEPDDNTRADINNCLQ